jgi:hypothetical protein
MTETVRRGKGASDSAVFTAVTSVGDSSWDICIDRVAYHKIGHMPSSDPGDHEEPEENIANSGVTKVFQAFCNL